MIYDYEDDDDDDFEVWVSETTKFMRDMVLFGRSSVHACSLFVVPLRL